MTETPSYLFDQLRPEEIGGLYGRKKSFIESTEPNRLLFLKEFLRLAELLPRSRFLLIGVVWITIILTVGACDHALMAPKAIPTLVPILIRPRKNPSQLSLALLQDPIAIIAIAMAIATPLFCAGQVTAIKDFNAMNERNIAYRKQCLNKEKINNHVMHANRVFEIVGRRTVSVGLLAVSLALSFVIDKLIHDRGLFAGWNYTSLNANSWRQRVYQGWWGNFPHHLPMAIVFWLLGGYYFYFLIKQLIMGFVFAVYARRARYLDFGVSPNMESNTDGYWGLRVLRHFMQTTYGSTLGHFTMVLCILVVWLPFSLFTILMVLGVMLINVLVVGYPSIIASSGAVTEKKQYVAHITARSDLSKTDRDAAVDKVWATPNLPFRLRSSFTAATVYVLIPLLLAVVSGLLGK